MEITKTYYAKNRAQWRTWLEKNHAKAKEIWLIYYKKGSGKPRIPYYDAVDEALCFGWIDGTVKTIDAQKYAQRFTPRRKRSSWSATNAARYRALLKSGLVAEAGKLAFAAKVRIEPKADGSKRGAYAWHLTHTIGKDPTMDRRLEWHLEHQKYCGCRPIPKVLIEYLTLRKKGG
jgi:uncharacterized protein YdeI (YjbR/CyaY-like superfamily)